LEGKMQTVEERVYRLEKVLEDFILSVGIEFNKLYNSQMRTEAEMRAFKEEMRAFKDEMKAFKEEMRAFKDEMLEFKKNQEEENRRKNKEWSNLAKKLGTLYEDLIAPALDSVLSKYFNCEAILEGQRMLRRKKGENYEVDAIAACKDKVFMIEVRSTPRIQYIDEIKEKSQRFFEFFPEFKTKKLYLILGSITFPEEVIKYASKQGIYVMGWRNWDYMDILNFEEIRE
jgi:hypothetical protein